jgi:hypothetical protein
LRDRTRYGARHQFPDGARILLAVEGQVLPDELVRHEIQADLLRDSSATRPETKIRQDRVSTYIRRHARNGRDNPAIQGHYPAFVLVHHDHGLPHAGQLFGPLAQLGERGGLDGQASADNVERVGERDGRDTGDAAAGEAVALVALKEMLRQRLACRPSSP